MRKHLFLIVLVLFAGLSAFAQEGEIFYTSFGEEGLTIEASYNNIPPWHFMDIDQDGTPELKLYFEYDHEYQLHPPYLHIEGVNWRTFISRSDTCCQYGDTLHSLLWPGTPPAYTGWSDEGYEPFSLMCWTESGYIPFAYSENGSFGDFQPVYSGYRYGWIRCRISWGFNQQHPYLTTCSLTLYEMAYCTMEDYLLRVGQTSFEWGLEDNTEEVAVVRPNPTRGEVTVTGERLRQIEVYDLVGQRIFTRQADTGIVTLDMSGLHPGMYLISITDNEGRKCVKKVVKE